MTPAELAALHACCFPAHPRPWTAAEFADLLAGPRNFLLLRPQGFLLGRSVADEAELLTLVVAPAARRQGIAAALLAEFAAAARLRGACAGFLEVAADNAAAIALYDGAGWTRAGLRRGYYAPGIDALVMRRGL
ncbi:GNAT family N-acetyltransferase [Paracoccus sp. (in: a-proteobacteria)]|uniref:GNAT family N-acetyltransferase n=1 Tax=Paracoccus sp. TaxID=267 RepID=UPI0032204054